MSDEKGAENFKNIYIYIPFIYTRPEGGANYLVFKNWGGGCSLGGGFFTGGLFTGGGGSLRFTVILVSRGHGRESNVKGPMREPATSIGICIRYCLGIFVWDGLNILRTLQVSPSSRQVV